MGCGKCALPFASSPPLPHSPPFAQNFVITDPSLPDNPIVFASQGFLTLTGYALNQILGRNCRFLQGPETDPAAVEKIRDAIHQGVDASVCLLNYRIDGSTFWNQVGIGLLGRLGGSGCCTSVLTTLTPFDSPPLPVPVLHRPAARQQRDSRELRWCAVQGERRLCTRARSRGERREKYGHHHAEHIGALKRCSGVWGGRWVASAAWRSEMALGTMGMRAGRGDVWRSACALVKVAVGWRWARVRSLKSPCDGAVRGARLNLGAHAAKDTPTRYDEKVACSSVSVLAIRSRAASSGASALCRAVADLREGRRWRRWGWYC